MPKRCYRAATARESVFPGLSKYHLQLNAYFPRGLNRRSSEKRRGRAACGAKLRGSEVRAAQQVIRVTEIRVIEHVEEIRADRQARSFAELGNPEPPGDRCVHGVK